MGAITLGWVAGSVRARALLSRRIGRAGARSVATGASLPAALHTLADTPYGHDVRVDHTLTEAEHAIGATALWHLRVLAGWQPRGGADLARALAAGFEIANVEQLMARWSASTGVAQPPPPYRLGTLATAWPRLSAATSGRQLADSLTASAWGDPGGETPSAIAVAMRLSWAERIAAEIPDARRWAAGAVALIVARERFLADRPLVGASRLRATALLGAAAPDTPSYTAYRDALPSSARWAVRDADEPHRLWRAEAEWWTELERDGFALVGRARFDRRALVGTAALLAADAWRTRAALQAAARGPAWLEVFDALA